MRDFTTWLSSFKSSISDYSYYIDFTKVHRNVDKIKVELNILNSLIGSSSIEADFDALIGRYPETLKCIPLLLAVRENEIYALDGDGEFHYNFKQMNYSIEQYKKFMRKTGLFNLLEKHIIGNLVDYATGVETGLDSNGRKNRGGHLMENLVETYLEKTGLVKDETYFKEMKVGDIQAKWGINLSAITNEGKTVKKFDFVVKIGSVIYGIEVNFYSTSKTKMILSCICYFHPLQTGQIHGHVNIAKIGQKKTLIFVSNAFGHTRRIMKMSPVSNNVLFPLCLQGMK